MTVKQDEDVLRNVESVLDEWSDQAAGSVELLTSALLAQLVQSNYVLDEVTARQAVSQMVSKMIPASAGPFVAVRVRRAPSLTRGQNPRIVIEQQGEYGDAAIASLTGYRYILFRYVAKAGNRTSQLHLSRNETEHFFQLMQGQQSVRLQQIVPGEGLQEIEERQLVRSPRNLNSKIEVRGAKDLDRNYPSGEQRPIIVFERIEFDLFRYMLLLPSDDGYIELHSYLARVPRQGQSMQSKEMSLQELQQLWPGYREESAPSLLKGSQVQ